LPAGLRGKTHSKDENPDCHRRYKAKAKAGARRSKAVKACQKYGHTLPADEYGNEAVWGRCTKCGTYCTTPRRPGATSRESRGWRTREWNSPAPEHTPTYAEQEAVRATARPWSVIRNEKKRARAENIGYDDERDLESWLNTVSPWWAGEAYAEEEPSASMVGESLPRRVRRPEDHKLSGKEFQQRFRSDSTDHAHERWVRRSNERIEDEDAECLRTEIWVEEREREFEKRGEDPDGWKDVWLDPGYPPTQSMGDPDKKWKFHRGYPPVHLLEWRERQKAKVIDLPTGTTVEDAHPEERAA
jgi:hypothetical protein